MASRNATRPLSPLSGRVSLFQGPTKGIQLGLFGKRKPEYVEIGRGYEISAEGVSLRKALLDGEPSQIFPLLKQCADNPGQPDALAIHLSEVVSAFSTAGEGDLAPFATLVCDSPPACPRPENEKGEHEQYMDFVCETLFEGALTMMILQEDQNFGAPQYQQLLDSFVSTYKWTKVNFMSQSNSLEMDFDVIVGIGKHFHTFDPVVGPLIGNHNLRRYSDHS